MNWSMRPDKRFRLAVGSFVEVTTNNYDSLLVVVVEGEEEVAAPCRILVKFACGKKCIIELTDGPVDILYQIHNIPTNRY